MDSIAQDFEQTKGFIGEASDNVLVVAGDV
jgi:hypothetical protein